MKPRAPSPSETSRPATGVKPDLSTELLVLPDGRILVHNLTLVFADLLNELNPADDAFKLRASEPQTSDLNRAVAQDELRPGT